MTNTMAATTNPDPAAGLIIIMMILCAYFLPTIIAMFRGHFWRVFAVNLFFGWTGLGWISAFVLSLSGESRSERREKREAHRAIISMDRRSL